MDPGSPLDPEGTCEAPPPIHPPAPLLTCCWLLVVARRFCGPATALPTRLPKRCCDPIALHLPIQEQHFSLSTRTFLGAALPCLPLCFAPRPCRQLCSNLLPIPEAARAPARLAPSPPMKTPGPHHPSVLHPQPGRIPVCCPLTSNSTCS